MNDHGRQLFKGEGTHFEDSPVLKNSTSQSIIVMHTQVASGEAMCINMCTQHTYNYTNVDMDITLMCVHNWMIQLGKV